MALKPESEWPELVEAFKKQCRTAGDPGLVLLAWHMSGDLPDTELFDAIKEVESE